MTLASTLVMTLCTVLFERDRWIAPPPATWGAIAYNALLIFGFAQAIWLIMARNLPPIASSMSVMMIPVLGVVSGAWWLNEQLHWQDGAAIVLVIVAIAMVLLPARRPRPAFGESAGRARGVGIGEAEAGEDRGLARLHRLRLGWPAVVEALGVQGTVHQQVRVVRVEPDALLGRLALDHRGAEHEVGDDRSARAGSRRSARWSRSPCHGTRG